MVNEIGHVFNETHENTCNDITVFLKFRSAYLKSQGETIRYPLLDNRSEEYARIVKRHTIRTDKSERWRKGMKIHFYVGRYTDKGRVQFAPICLCTGVQDIRIVVTPHHWMISIDSGTRDGFVPFAHKGMNESGALELANNDGFLTLESFLEYFERASNGGVFEGRIIHWAGLNYSF